jgi:hypothetical protein
MKKEIKALGLSNIGGREWDSRTTLDLSALHDSNLGHGSKLRFGFVFFECIMITKTFSQDQEFRKRLHVSVVIWQNKCRLHEDVTPSRRVKMLLNLTSSPVSLSSPSGC